MERGSLAYGNTQGKVLGVATGQLAHADGFWFPDSRHPEDHRPGDAALMQRLNELVRVSACIDHQLFSDGYPATAVLRL
jgi:hypothetical protein